jgi:hypothetical protein
MGSHHLDGLEQIGDRAIVKVRAGDRDVAKARHLEHHAVGLVAGDLEPALVLLVRPRHDRARTLKHQAADQVTGVALHATEIGEHLDALDLLMIEGLGVAGQKRIPPSGRDQGALEGGDRLGGVVEVDG